MIEARLGDVPYTVEDVTAAIDQAGEDERLRRIDEKQERYRAGVETLLAEIDRRANSCLPAILKREAEDFLMTTSLTRKEARNITGDLVFCGTAKIGKGHPVELGRSAPPMKVVGLAEMPKSLETASLLGVSDTLFGPPYKHWTAEIPTNETPMDKGDFKPAISAAPAICIEAKDGGRNGRNANEAPPEAFTPVLEMQISTPAPGPPATVVAPAEAHPELDDEDFFAAVLGEGKEDIRL